jgi:hypothetical protein
MVSNDGHDGPIVEIEEDDTNIFGVKASMEVFCKYMMLNDNVDCYVFLQVVKCSFPKHLLALNGYFNILQK